MAVLQLVTMFLLLQTPNSLQRCFKPSKKPNIIVIIGDDMGHNDISLRGSNQIPTPNIDALGYHGIVLDKYYVQNACTPSRAAFLTGNYPIRSRMQGVPIVAGQNRSMPLDMVLMPEHLRRLGYKNHIVGKWHLGSAYRSSTPTRRGFDSHFGYWNGFLGYFDYYTDYNDEPVEGFDLHDTFLPAWQSQGKYATSLFTDKALDIIDVHNTTHPLFLLVAHLAAHAGRDGVELGVPNITSTNLKYAYIRDPRRRLYAEIVNQLDQSVGKIVKRLALRKMLRNSIVLFFSDNGAPTVGGYANSGSNWPLRGLKMTNFEGAIRGTATVFSTMFKKRGYVNTELMHVTDWLPTLYAAAGGNIEDLGPIDGFNQWETLSRNRATSRSEILVNIDEIQNTTSIIAAKGRYKLVTGIFDEGRKDGYFGESGRYSTVPPYDFKAVLNSDTNVAIQNVTKARLTRTKMTYMRSRVDLSWCRGDEYQPFLNCSNVCLFELEVDPCETSNVVQERPDIAEELLGRIGEFYQVLVPQGVVPLDPRANPQRYNNTWCTWLDDTWCVKTPNTKLA